MGTQPENKSEPNFGTRSFCDRFDDPKYWTRNNLYQQFWDYKKPKRPDSYLTKLVKDIHGFY